MVAGPIARIVAQAIVIGAGIVSRAFLQAYQQAAAQAKAGGGAKAAQEAAKRTLRNKMSEDEAMKILNLDSKPKTMSEVIAQYDKYFAANDPKKGGSFYLQSKIHRARETLQSTLEEVEEKETKKSSE
mmetsp:Transcript_16997/g.19324  ORF Transcript_16997/g.19324 Transcript_16997/m.19324 type:complete len:128 (+) Transcript_16997:208-591(+)|eukprot:CAMPEP_0184015498 /NCGR_PEP_ID=MMETSP0954-20121128/6339_1 /TAXON_ID=627963 /ORGANISM="Aplanochytrium sp, Strain PBS07" /LENGTH=127 /DNA_ID=CAMNT_0026296279 /DNA_START=187 /DNA_END=570 /DNA_ORIENTATION=-